MGHVSTIRGDQSVVSICEALGDRISYSVLLSVMKSAKSASDICVERGLPISSTYKALKKLQEVGLIKSSLVDRDGRRLSIYRSKVKQLRIVVETKDAKVDLINQEPDFNGPDEIDVIKVQEN